MAEFFGCLVLSQLHRMQGEPEIAFVWFALGIVWGVIDILRVV